MIIMSIGERKMIELYNLGIDENTIKEMLQINSGIKDLEPEEIITKINILKKLNCTDEQINNIIGSNALLFNLTDEEIIALINRLKELGFTCLNTLLDGNPYILNISLSELNEYIDKRLKKETLEEVVDDLDSNPYKFLDI